MSALSREIVDAFAGREAAMQAAMESFVELGWEQLPNISLSHAALPPVGPYFALAHPAFGIALLNMAPDSPPDILTNLLRRLDAVGFAEAFPGQLPIVQGSLTVEDVWRIPIVLDSLFATHPPIEMKGREWIDSVRQALTLKHSQNRDDLEPGSAAGMHDDAGAIAGVESGSSAFAGADPTAADDGQTVLRTPSKLVDFAIVPPAMVPSGIATHAIETDEAGATETVNLSPALLLPAEALVETSAPLRVVDNVRQEMATPPVRILGGRVVAAGLFMFALSIGIWWLDQTRPLQRQDEAASILLAGGPAVQIASTASSHTDAINAFASPDPAIPTPDHAAAALISPLPQVLAEPNAFMPAPEPTRPEAVSSSPAATPLSEWPPPPDALSAEFFVPDNLSSNFAAPEPLHALPRPDLEPDATPQSTALAPAEPLVQPDAAPELPMAVEPAPTEPASQPATPPPAIVVADPPESTRRAEAPSVASFTMTGLPAEPVGTREERPLAMDTAPAEPIRQGDAPPSVFEPEAPLPTQQATGAAAPQIEPLHQAEAAPVLPLASVLTPTEPALNPATPPAPLVIPPSVQLAPASTPVPVLEPHLIGLLVVRGNEMLGRGDVSAARLLYSRAAAAGSAAAAAAMARTFDPEVLNALGVHGIRPDAAQAAQWHRRAAELNGKP